MFLRTDKNNDLGAKYRYMPRVSKTTNKYKKTAFYIKDKPKFRLSESEEK